MFGAVLSSIEAIIPAGTWRLPGDPQRPADLGQRAGRNHLDRTLTELGAAGITSAIIVTSPRLFSVRWLGRALRESTARLSGNLSVEVLVVDAAHSVDDLVLAAVNHVVTDWVAVASPLHSFADFDTMSQVVTTAEIKGGAAIALAETGWEEAIQLCQPICDGDLVTGLRPHAAQDSLVQVFGGRAVFPAAALKEASGDPDLSVMDYDKLVHRLISAGKPVHASRIAAPLLDARFQNPDDEHSAAQAMFLTRRLPTIANSSTAL